MCFLFCIYCCAMQVFVPQILINCQINPRVINPDAPVITYSDDGRCLRFIDLRCAITLYGAPCSFNMKPWRRRKTRRWNGCHLFKSATHSPLLYFSFVFALSLMFIFIHSCALSYTSMFWKFSGSIAKQSNYVCIAMIFGAIDTSQLALWLPRKLWQSYFCVIMSILKSG